MLPDCLLCAVSLPISALLAWGTMALLAVAVLMAAGLELGDVALAVVLLLSPAAGRSPHTLFCGESSYSNE